MVTSGIEEIGSELTGAKVTVEEVSLCLFSESGTVRGLKVDNPDAFESEHAIVVESVETHLA